MIASRSLPAARSTQRVGSHPQALAVAAAACSGRRRLAIVERVLYVLAALFLGWYLLQHAITAYQAAAANRELESAHMAVNTPTSTAPRLTTGALIGRVEIPRVGVSAIIREGDDAATLRHAV